MSNPFFEHPILNSPYDNPIRHWELDKEGQPTQRIIESRRRAEFITPIPKPKKRKASTEQQSLIFDEGNGVDVFHPNTGEVRRDGAEGITCCFIDTDYNMESFFVRHAYFLGANDGLCQHRCRHFLNHQHSPTISSAPRRTFRETEPVGDSLRKFLIETFLEKHYQKRLVWDVTLIGEHLEMIEHRFRQPE
jgi:hypothetical protein